MKIKVEPIADVHVHLREIGDVMSALIVASAEGGADVLGAMPNTSAGLRTFMDVDNYIAAARSRANSTANLTFIPFLMITEDTKLKQIDACVAAGIVNAKVYPRMRTTKSENGVKRYGKILPIIKHCGKVGMKVHFHPEHPSILHFNRDAEMQFIPLVDIFLQETSAIVVWEHGTDARCIPHWKYFVDSGRFYLTLTAHHLATNEDLVFGDVRAVCKPPIKTERDRRDLIALIAEDHYWVMAGSDSAYHPLERKHVFDGSCDCGALTAPFLHQLYAHALDDIICSGGTETYINFTSRNARYFHDLPQSKRTIYLEREEWEIPVTYTLAGRKGLPFWGGAKLNWRIVE